MANEPSGPSGNFDSSWNNTIRIDDFWNQQEPVNVESLLGFVGCNEEIPLPIEIEKEFVNENTLITSSSEAFLSLIKDESTEVDNIASSTFIAKPASLPASQNWPGIYGFNISFNIQDKKTKGVTWTYNEAKDKLYVGKEAPCPINFSTEYEMPVGVKIRAMALYSSPESASEVVERCINHAGEDRAKHILEAEHLVRCESPMAVYEVDPISKRYSVNIPFENPPPGQSFSTYIFKFACFGSCPGPSRRPIMVVFSLEKENQTIGRRTLDVKICACPGRDSKTEEEQSGSSKKRKRKYESPAKDFSSMVSANTSSTPLSKKTKEVPDQDGYKIMVKDKKCFEFLEQMKKYYGIMKTMKNMPPDVKKLLEQHQQRKGYKLPDDLNLHL